MIYNLGERKYLNHSLVIDEYCALVLNIVLCQLFWNSENPISISGYTTARVAFSDLLPRRLESVGSYNTFPVMFILLLLMFLIESFPF